MKIIGNILGDMSGQLGKKIVGFKWKGIDVFRSYVIPANPNTVPQQHQRTAFAEVLQFAQEFITSIIHPLWKKFAIKKSAFNAFMGANLKAMGYPVDYTSAVFSKGDLYPVALSGVTYDSVTGATVFTHATTEGSNGLATDLVQGILFDKVNSIGYVTNTSTRGDSFVSQNFTAGLDFADLEGYLVVYRDLGMTTEMIGNSTYHAVAEA